MILLWDYLKYQFLLISEDSDNCDWFCFPGVLYCSFQIYKEVVNLLGQKKMNSNIL